MSECYKTNRSLAFCGWHHCIANKAGVALGLGLVHTVVLPHHTGCVQVAEVEPHSHIVNTMSHPFVRLSFDGFIIRTVPWGMFSGLKYTDWPTEHCVNWGWCPAFMWEKVCWHCSKLVREVMNVVSLNLDALYMTCFTIQIWVFEVALSWNQQCCSSLHVSSDIAVL